MRVAFLGNDRWSVPTLDAVHASAHDVVLVVTAPPRPAGRGRHETPTAVARRARELGLPLNETGGNLVPVLADAEPDALVVVAYGRLLTQAALDVAAVAPINLHFSLLPELRGASPVETALLRGDRRTGVSVIRMTADLDAGPVYAAREVAIAPDDDAGRLGGRLAVLGASLVVETLDALAEGRAVAMAQDEERVTWCGRLGAEDRRLRWADEDAARTVDRCRASTPPGAWTTFRGKQLKVLAASIEEGSGAPGSILAVDRGGIVVAASDGAVRLREVVPQGRGRMSASDFAHGVRPDVGERLG
jgi:methionyl-tRNA formyltransferase